MKLDSNKKVSLALIHFTLPQQRRYMLKTDQGDSISNKEIDAYTLTRPNIENVVKGSFHVKSTQKILTPPI